MRSPACPFSSPWVSFAPVVGVADGVAVGALQPHDTRAQAEQFTTREGAREVAREVDDERSGEGLHGRRKLPARTHSEWVTAIP